MSDTKWPENLADIAYSARVGYNWFPFTEVGVCLHCNEYYTLTQPCFERKPLSSLYESAPILGLSPAKKP